MHRCTIVQLGLWVFVLTGWSRAAAQSPEAIWFDDVDQPIEISASEQNALLHLIANSEPQERPRNEDLPAGLRDDTASRIVFLSVSDGTAPAHVAIGVGRGIMAAVDRALSQAEMLTEKSGPLTWFKLDVVDRVETLRGFNLSEPLGFDPSLEGIALNRQARVAYLPGRLAVSRLRKALRSENQTAYRFTTLSLFTDGEQSARLYRGHRLFAKPSKAVLLDAARGGGDYLARAVDEDGRFTYSYLPTTGRVPRKYNLPRHAGTIYAMLELYQVDGREEVLRAAERAIGYLLRAVQDPGRGAGDVAVVVERGYVKLGANALACIALAKYIEITGNLEHLEPLRKLGRWMRGVQAASGRFLIHKQLFASGEVKDFISSYYPGEAILAFIRIHQLDHDAGWLDGAESGARYLITERDGGLMPEELEHDHWLLYALNELYRLAPDPLYLDHARRIAGAIVEAQNVAPEELDWRGSYNKPPRSTPTATRSEGLLAAYRLVRDFGSAAETKAETDRMLQAIKLGVGFQLQTQFRPENAMYFKEPWRVALPRRDQKHRRGQSR